MNWILKKLKGRTTSFCIAFFVTGNALQVFHRLDQTYVLFMGTLLGAVIGHSIKEDMLPTTIPPIVPPPAGPQP